MLDEEKVLEIIAEGLDIERSEISLKTKSSDLIEWDSLGHLTLLMKLDENFNNVTEKFPEIASASSVLELLNLLKKHKAEF